LIAIKDAARGWRIIALGGAMAHLVRIEPRDVTEFAAKVAFLRCPQAYPDRPLLVEVHETHMSCVFLTPDHVYKLKKPVRFPYLDFSTLDRREAACRAELRLNQRLARHVYLGLVPLTETAQGLALGAAEGRIVDWLVVMRRLDETRMLDHVIAQGRLRSADVDRLAIMLAAFFRRCQRTTISPAAHMESWRQSVAYNREVLLHPRLRVAAGLVRRIDRVQRRFLAQCGDLIVKRVRSRDIVDGHGDLRPEHIWLGDPPCVIDCLEFNAGLRANDPFDEIAFLTLECSRLGTPWAADRLRGRMMRHLPRPPPEPLFAFYRSHRAMLRARLAMAHLLEANPRTREKWGNAARAYLALAMSDARKLEQYLRRSAGRSRNGRHEAAGQYPRAAARPKGHPSLPMPAQTGGRPARCRSRSSDRWPVRRGPRPNRA
jgi:uncharacterized protein